MHYLLHVAAGGMSLLILTASSNFAEADDPTRTEINKLVRGLDYVVVEPSSNVYKPGSFINRRQYDPNEQIVSTTKLQFLCTPEYSTAKIDVDAIRRPITDFSALFGGDWIELSRDFVKRQLKMPITADYAETIGVRIVDQAIVEYSSERLQKIRDSLGPICKSNIQINSKKGNAYQITGVYELRLQYEVKYQNNPTVDVRSRFTMR